MINKLEHRGPDPKGGLTWIPDSSWCNRLSILELSESGHPYDFLLQAVHHYF